MPRFPVSPGPGDRTLPAHGQRRLRRAIGVAAGTALLLAALAPSALGAVRSLRWRALPRTLDASATTAAAVPQLALAAQALPPVVRQRGSADCGPAALATVLAWRGRPAGLDTVRAAARLRADGASLAEMARLASAFELPGAWYRVPRHALAALPTPFLAHLTTDGGHYVAVRWVGRGFVLAADPARGLVLERMGPFGRTWRGRVLLFDAVVAEARSGAS